MTAVTIFWLLTGFQAVVLIAYVEWVHRSDMIRRARVMTEARILQSLDFLLWIGATPLLVAWIGFMSIWARGLRIDVNWAISPVYLALGYYIIRKLLSLRERQ
ncbi:MAG: hypothetical protein IT285_01105 [Bdellovibrionales bacterium]|nr:hypothetical protein [Bdellovibrionales bacterium]